MTTSPDQHDRSVVTITLREIYLSIKDIDSKLDNELGKIKTQLAAQWVIHGIVLAIVVGVTTTALNR